MRDSEKTVGLMADKCKVCYLSYIDVNGFPATRAMLKPRERDGIKTFYFSTNTSSKKVSCFKNNPNASLYFVDTRFYRAYALQARWKYLKMPKQKNVYGISVIRCIIKRELPTPITAF